VRAVVFACAVSGIPAWQKAGDCPGVECQEIPCAGGLDGLQVLEAFLAGAERVFVLACHPGACRSHLGTETVRQRVAYLQTELQAAGLDGGRLVLAHVSPDAGQRVRRILSGG
jgi:coenzyme F420-reducing hydrogenase delta subunit